MNYLENKIFLGFFILLGICFLILGIYSWDILPFYPLVLFFLASIFCGILAGDFLRKILLWKRENSPLKIYLSKDWHPYKM